MLLVPDLREVAGDLELHTLVERDLPRTFFPDTFVKIGDRRAQHAISNNLPAETRLMPRSYL